MQTHAPFVGADVAQNKRLTRSKKKLIIEAPLKSFFPLIGSLLDFISILLRHQEVIDVDVDDKMNFCVNVASQSSCQSIKNRAN